MVSAWPETAPGVLRLPSGRLVRGRGLRHGPRPMAPDYAPEFALVLLGREPEPPPWPHRWVPWPDFRLPRSPADLRAALLDVLDRAGSQRVEITCDGGRGRTGTALSCLAVLDGVPAAIAVEYVRAHYHPKAVETPWQRRFVARFG